MPPCFSSARRLAVKLVRAHSAAVVGIAAQPVVVEVQRGRGLPGIALVGLARGAVREASVRVRAALLAVGCSLGSYKLTVNLLPAEQPKEAAALDLPLALALLVAADKLPAEALSGRRFFGELSLGGALQPVRGAVLVAALAREAGDGLLVVPAANLPQAQLVPGQAAVGAHHLSCLCGALRRAPPGGPLQGEGIDIGAAAPRRGAATARLPSADAGLCLSQVAGQQLAKRALVVAAAGGHHLLMVGPPGSGKSMLARRLSGLLPPLQPKEQVEVTRIMAAAGAPVTALADRRPYRSPHHSASAVALCGGGSPPRPGEVTLAHLGVLFLDELAEFGRRSLETLREPLEEGSVLISRAAGSLRFPSRLQLVAATNPCPCGHHGAAGGRRRCVCSTAQIDAYRARISGPLLDRMDLCVRVSPVPLGQLLQPPPAGAPTSNQLRQQVGAARQRQLQRHGCLNAQLGLDRLGGLLPAAQDFFATRSPRDGPNQLSSRGILKMLRVAQTLIDLGLCPAHSPQAVGEAVRLGGHAADAWGADEAGAEE